MARTAELLDGVYDITCAERETARIRAFLFDTVAGGHLVDTGLPETTDALLDGIAETGLTVDRVVITHADGDHVGGLEAVVEAYDPEVWLPMGADPDVAPDVDGFYGDEDAIGPFEAVHVPGHRGHQHALVWEERAVAVLADAVSGADQRGFPAGYFHLPPGVYSDDLNRAEESLSRLLDYEFDAGLVFHGSSVLSDASERLAAYVYDP